MTTTDHIANALDHVSEDSAALSDLQDAMGALNRAFDAVEPTKVNVCELEDEIAALQTFTSLTCARLSERIRDEASRAATLLAREVVETVRSRSEQDGPIQWLTGNSFMPPLRSLPEAERVYQEGTDMAWDAFSETFFAALESANVLCEAPEYDNALYCVDLSVWEHIDDGTQERDPETLEEEWRRIARDPVETNQSKHVDSEGVLRYDADDSEVFPGATGVRDSNSIGELGQWRNDA